MKKYTGILIAALVALAPNAFAANGFKGESFEKVFHFSGPLGKGSKSGLNAANAKPIADTDLMAIEAGTVITKVFAIIDTAITGTTALTVGDDDGAASFVADLVAGFATPGLYGWDAKSAGAYLRVETAGATDASDIYVVPAAKYYPVAGKEIKLDNTTTNTAGALRVVVQGYRL